MTTDGMILDVESTNYDQLEHAQSELDPLNRQRLEGINETGGSFGSRTVPRSMLGLIFYRMV